MVKLSIKQLTSLIVTIALASFFGNNGMREQKKPDPQQFTLAKFVKTETNFSATTITKLDLTLCKRDLGEQQIHERLRQCNIFIQNVDLNDKKTSSRCYNACFSDYGGTLGICNAQISICTNVPSYLKSTALMNSSMTPSELWDQYLQNIRNFAVLELFSTYSQYGGQGYGPLFWNKMIDFLQQNYPQITTLIFIASPLPRTNRLSPEKLYEFYQKCGARQVDPNRSYS